jgi:hypothetical protein
MELSSKGLDDRIVLSVIVKNDRCFKISTIKSGSTNKTELDGQWRNSDSSLILR